MPDHVNVEDRAEISDLLGRYCWHVDEGEGEAWADLWTPDGEFAGVSPKPIRGRDGLKHVPARSLAGGCRHQLTNLFMDYGATSEEVIVKGYNLVTTWADGPRLHVMGMSKFKIVRLDGRWKIRSNQVRLLTGPNYDVGLLPEGLPPPTQPTLFPSLD